MVVIWIWIFRNIAWKWKRTSKHWIWLLLIWVEAKYLHAGGSKLSATILSGEMKLFVDVRCNQIVNHCLAITQKIVIELNRIWIELYFSTKSSYRHLVRQLYKGTAERVSPTNARQTVSPRHHPQNSAFYCIFSWYQIIKLFQSIQVENHIHTVGSRKNTMLHGTIIEGNGDFVATFGVNNTPIYMSSSWWASWYLEAYVYM